MLKKARQVLIMKELNLHNKVLHSDLSDKLNVSEDTIRRDIHELFSKGKLVKVRGGALSKSFHVYSYRDNEIFKQKEKIRIANKAISLLADGMLVLISGGTTNLELVRILPEDLKLTFYTPSLPIAMQLAEHPNCQTVFIGGKISHNSKFATGGEVVNTIRGIRPDVCFMGTNSIDSKLGPTDSDWEVVEVKKSMIAVSNKVVVLTISDKLQSVQKIRICDNICIDYLITELDSDAKMLLPFKELGIKIL